MASDMFYGASAKLFTYAERLRRDMTPAELMLWEVLRMNKFNGFRFKAQHPINHFVADFHCHKALLVVELDGAVHNSDEQREYDSNRTYTIEEFGIRVIRFRNEEVVEDIDTVLETIGQFLLS